MYVLVFWKEHIGLVEYPNVSNSRIAEMYVRQHFRPRIYTTECLLHPDALTLDNITDVLSNYVEIEPNVYQVGEDTFEVIETLKKMNVNLNVLRTLFKQLVYKEKTWTSINKLKRITNRNDIADLLMEQGFIVRPCIFKSGRYHPERLCNFFELQSVSKTHDTPGFCGSKDEHDLTGSIASLELDCPKPLTFPRLNVF